MSRAYPEPVLEAMIHANPLEVEQLKNKEDVDAWVANMSELLGIDTSTGVNYVFSTVEDEERNLYYPSVNVYVHGIATEYLFNQEFFELPAYAGMKKLGETLRGLFEDGSYVKRGEKTQLVNDFKQVLDWLMREAQKGLSIQRYKGLGEMNPEQLWETTMDPETRRMMKVTIEDAVAADMIFTTLMGDEVEPRRAFIQTNALEVTNLDV